jgi:hypothetical protein
MTKWGDLKGRPKTVTVDGREYSSYITFRIRINLNKCRGWQMVQAPDASGDMCDQILLPLHQNGLQRTKSGWVWIISAMVTEARHGKHQTHVLIPLINQESLDWLEAHGIISPERTPRECAPIIGEMFEITEAYNDYHEKKPV